MSFFPWSKKDKKSKEKKSATVAQQASSPASSSSNEISKFLFNFATVAQLLADQNALKCILNIPLPRGGQDRGLFLLQKLKRTLSYQREN